MWMSPDGRVNTVAIPLERCPQLVSLIAALSVAERENLDDVLELREWSTYDALDALTFDADDESRFAAMPLPDELLAACDWPALVASEGAALDQIDLRWRLDVLAIMQQARAEAPE